ncbi:hypothetical protein PIB30_044020 [Stylosanthes scabra]|uniref:Transmembrane protein n=1 Tax=Stylosanthes scabra TaxID=79078 RepID=A0ABU6YED9_9FABA|nr:hypothetical protein [Stylosanthes scabra]
MDSFSNDELLLLPRSRVLLLLSWTLSLSLSLVTLHLYFVLSLSFKLRSLFYGAPSLIFLTKAVAGGTGRETYQTREEEAVEYGWRIRNGKEEGGKLKRERKQCRKKERGRKCTIIKIS